MSLTATFLAHTALLGVLPNPSDHDQTGMAWAIVESSTDDVDSTSQTYAVAIHLRQIGEGSVRARVLTSHDGVLWTVAAESRVLDGPGQEIYEVLEPTMLLRHVAVVTELHGDPRPNHVYSASLLSNGRLRLIRTNKVVDPAVFGGGHGDKSLTACGRDVVLDGESQVDVGFSHPWPDDHYTVVVSPEGQAVSCWVEGRDENGFTIHTSAPVDGDTTIHWMAVHD